MGLIIKNTIKMTKKELLQLAKDKNLNFESMDAIQSFVSADLQKFFSNNKIIILYLYQYFGNADAAFYQYQFVDAVLSLPHEAQKFLGNFLYYHNTLRTLFKTTALKAPHTSIKYNMLQLSKCTSYTLQACCKQAPEEAILYGHQILLQKHRTLLRSICLSRIEYALEHAGEYIYQNDRRLFRELAEKLPSKANEIEYKMRKLELQNI